MSTELYDLTPVIRMALLVVLLAAVPLAWVWLRNRRRSPAARLRALTLLTLFLTFDLVAFGAFTRLTDSGLGCPDWPGCYGSASPLGAADDIHAAQTALPEGPVTHRKAWIEMIHRYLAAAVGVLITVMAVSSWWLKFHPTPGRPKLDGPPWGAGCAQRSPGGPQFHPTPGRPKLDGPPWGAGCAQRSPGGPQFHPTPGRPKLDGPPWGAGCAQRSPGGPQFHPTPGPVSPWWATFTWLVVCLQGAFGAFTVTFKLYPAVVTGHLLGGLALLVLLAVQAEAHTGRTLALGPRLRAGVAVVFLLSLVQITLGGWVSTNYAVLACTEFPACQGSWWPAMDFANGFTPWRALGRTADGGYLSVPALTAIHMVHRWGAFVVLATLCALAWALWRQNDPGGRPWGGALAGVAAWQFLSGLSNVILGWPLVAALAHTAGAAALLVLLTVLWCRATYNPLPHG